MVELASLVRITWPTIHCLFTTMPVSSADENRKIEQEIRLGHQFSLADVIGQQAGSFLQGDAAIPRLVRANTAINGFIDQHLSDSSGALDAVLRNWVKIEETRVSQHLDDPLMALREILLLVTDNPQMLYEFARQVDVKWGNIYGERPRFQQPNQPPHPDDEYTHESVHAQLIALLKSLESSLNL